MLQGRTWWTGASLSMSTRQQRRTDDDGRAAECKIIRAENKKCQRLCHPNAAGVPGGWGLRIPESERVDASRLALGICRIRRCVDAWRRRDHGFDREFFLSINLFYRVSALLSLALVVLESWYGLLVMEELQPLFRSVAPFLEATREKVSEGLSCRLILDGNRARKTGVPCRRVSVGFGQMLGVQAGY